MFLLKKKYIIKLGFNLGLKKLSQYNFLIAIIVSNKLFSSIIDLDLIFYKLLLLRSFIKIYKHLTNEDSKLLMVDGTDINNKQRRNNFEMYIKNSNQFFISQDLWFSKAKDELQLDKIHFILYWDYASLIINFNPWDINVPFIFFFQALPEFFKFINISKFKESHFIFSTVESEAINFFWLSIFIHIINITKWTNQ